MTSGTFRIVFRLNNSTKKKSCQIKIKMQQKIVEAARRILMDFFLFKVENAFVEYATEDYAA